jgi:hypothetical protein
MPAPILERAFADQRLAVRLASRAWEFPFRDFAEQLALAYGGTIVARLGAAVVDDAYWDIRIRGQVLTLHYQHYAGVFLSATDESSEGLLTEILPFVAAYRPPTLWRRIRFAVRNLRHAGPR